MERVLSFDVRYVVRAWVTSFHISWLHLHVRSRWASVSCMSKNEDKEQRFCWILPFPTRKEAWSFHLQQQSSHMILRRWRPKYQYSSERYHINFAFRWVIFPHQQSLGKAVYLFHKYYHCLPLLLNLLLSSLEQVFDSFQYFQQWQIFL